MMQVTRQRVQTKALGGPFAYAVRSDVRLLIVAVPLGQASPSRIAETQRNGWKRSSS